MELTADQITELVDGRLTGPGDIVVRSLAMFDIADGGQLVFIGDEAHAERWAACKATVGLIEAGLSVQPGDGRALVSVENVDLAMAKVLEVFAPPEMLPEPGVDPSAVVATSAQLGVDVRVGPHCVIGNRVVIESGTVIHAGVKIFDDVKVGCNCVIWAGVVIRERCSIGKGVIIHPNASIGADGFGFRPSADGKSMVKIPHVGGVKIGDDVEIGACSCIDRGKFSDTVIGDQSKIDNLVQIGHNCIIGRCVIIAGSCGIAGSVTIGDGAMFGGMVAIKDHITIGQGVRLAGCAQVMNDVPAGETWAGSPAREIGVALREHVAIRRLPSLIKKMKKAK